MSRLRQLTRALALLVAVGAASGRAAAAGPALPGVARVTLTVGGWEQRRFVAPGEWVPYPCSLAMPYRGGSALRFGTRDTAVTYVTTDGGAERPAWISVSATDGLAHLARALDQGAVGFTVRCETDKLAALPILPRGRDIALAVAGDVKDFAPIARQSGVSALAFYSTRLADFAPLAALPDLSSLRLSGFRLVADLRPLARLPKLTFIRIVSMPRVEDLSPLAELPNLQGLELFSCEKVTDLTPLARLPRLQMLKVRSCRGVTDLTPLAKLTHLKAFLLSEADVADIRPLAGLNELVELDLSGCEKVDDLTPIRRPIRRGATVSVSDRLKPQLEAIRAATDF